MTHELQRQSFDPSSLGTTPFGVVKVRVQSLLCTRIYKKKHRVNIEKDARSEAPPFDLHLDPISTKIKTEATVTYVEVYLPCLP